MASGKTSDRVMHGTEAAATSAEAMRRFPDEPEPAFACCLAMLQGADPGAGALLQQLLARFPAHAPGWEKLGLWLLAAGKTEAALVCLRRAVAVAPSARSALACGSALRGLGRLEEAREFFATACRLAPHLARPAFLHALCAQDAGDFATARAGYETALALDPTLPEAWVNLGIVLQEQGDLDGARKAYGAAVGRRADAFGRVSQALTASPRGELWLDLGRLRRTLAG